MKYCPSCKKVFSDSETRCEKCKKNLKNIDDINEPVQLALVGGTDRALLIGLLDDNDIPYLEQHVTPQGVSNDIVTGYDVKLSNIYILVPFSALPKAYDLSKNIEINNEYIESLLDEINNTIDKYKSSNNDDKEEMSQTKRTLIKVISAIIFLILIALVVFGTDYVMGIIKNLLGAQ